MEKSQTRRLLSGSKLLMAEICHLTAEPFHVLTNFVYSADHPMLKPIILLKPITASVFLVRKSCGGWPVIGGRLPHCPTSRLLIFHRTIFASEKWCGLSALMLDWQGEGCRCMLQWGIRPEVDCPKRFSERNSFGGRSASGWQPRATACQPIANRQHFLFRKTPGMIGFNKYCVTGDQQLTCKLPHQLASQNANRLPHDFFVSGKRVEWSALTPD